MTDETPISDSFDDEMSQYMETFLDETEEQLDDLVETMLLLENSSTNEQGLGEAFRLVHSIKGAAGMMGLDHITVLTHHLENRFERFRSGTEQLDEPTMNLVLRCIDFLRECSDRLRDGQSLGSPAELLSELKALEDRAAAPGGGEPKTSETPAVNDPSGEPTELLPPRDHSSLHVIESTPSPSIAPHVDDDVVRIIIRFRSGLQLVDLKAQLIVNRLAALGDLRSSNPALDALVGDESLLQLEIQLETSTGLERLRLAADVEGVESIDFSRRRNRSDSRSGCRAAARILDPAR